MCTARLEYEQSLQSATFRCVAVDSALGCILPSNWRQLLSLERIYLPCLGTYFLPFQNPREEVERSIIDQSATISCKAVDSCLVGLVYVGEAVFGSSPRRRTMLIS